MADYQATGQASASIVDQLLGATRGQQSQQPQLPNIYGVDPRMPPPNLGVTVPNPQGLVDHALQQQQQQQQQKGWWEDDQTPAPAPASTAQPAPATPPAITAPTTPPTPSPTFDVGQVSLYGDKFKVTDIAAVVDGLVADGRINPMRAVQQADLDALIGGDMTKLPAVLNAAVAAGIKEAMTATTTLVSNSLGAALAPVFDRYSQHTEGQAATVTVNNEYKTPAERTLAGMFREKYLAKYPRANAQQVAQAVKQAMDALGTDMVTARQPQNKVPQPVDWVSELN